MTRMIYLFKHIIAPFVFNQSFQPEKKIRPIILKTMF